MSLTTRSPPQRLQIVTKCGIKLDQRSIELGDHTHWAASIGHDVA